MLKKISNYYLKKDFRNFFVNTFEFFYECLFNTTLVCFSNQHPLVLDNITYLNKKQCYVLLFRFKNSTKNLTIKTKEFFEDKELINLINPINAYFVGIIMGLETNNIVLEDCSKISAQFKKFNQFGYARPLIKITNIKLSDSNEFITIKTKFSSKYTKIPMLDISKKPYLLQAFENSDALYLGMKSLDFFLQT